MVRTKQLYKHGAPRSADNDIPHPHITLVTGQDIRQPLYHIIVNQTSPNPIQLPSELITYLRTKLDFRKVRTTYVHLDPQPESPTQSVINYAKSLFPRSDVIFADLPDSIACREKPVILSVNDYTPDSLTFPSDPSQATSRNYRPDPKQPQPLTLQDIRTQMTEAHLDSNLPEHK